MSCIFLFSGSSSCSTIFLCASLRILDVHFGNAVVARDRLARAIGQRQHDKEIILADERAFELRSIGQRHGDGVAGTAAAAAPAAAKAAVEPATHPFWSALASSNFDAMPLRSPVTEWHEEQSEVNAASPAFASPTRTLSSAPVGLRPGGLPWPLIVAWML